MSGYPTYQDLAHRKFPEGYFWAARREERFPVDAVYTLATGMQNGYSEAVLGRHQDRGWADDGCRSNLISAKAESAMLIRIVKTLAKVSFVLVILVLISLPFYPRTKVFPRSCDQVWKVAERANTKNRALYLSSSGAGCKVSVGDVFSEHDNTDLFERIDDELGIKRPADARKVVSRILSWTGYNWVWVIAAVMLLFQFRQERRKNQVNRQIGR